MKIGCGTELEKRGEEPNILKIGGIIICRLRAAIHSGQKLPEKSHFESLSAQRFSQNFRKCGFRGNSIGWRLIFLRLFSICL